jgi:DNA-binding NtrC family response regulator
MAAVVAVLGDRVADGIAEAKAAVALAERDGHYSVRIGALGNVAQFSIAAGAFEQADEYLQLATAITTLGSHADRCLSDTRAQLHLARGEADAAARCLLKWDREDSERPERFGPAPDIDATRVELLRQQGRTEDAIALAARAVQVARAREEGFIEPLLTVRYAEVLAHGGHGTVAEKVLGELVARDISMPLHVVAEIEKAKGRLNVLAGRAEDGRRCFARGRRLAKALGRAQPLRDEQFPAERTVCRKTKGGGWSAIESLAVCGRLAGRPELHGEELLEVFLDSGAVRRARFLSTRGGPTRLMKRVGKTKGNSRAAQAVLLKLGKVDGVSYELHVEPKQDIRSRSIVSAVCRLVKDSLALAKLQDEAKYRESLWPVEEGLMLEGNVFVAPRMREIQTTARRVAPSELPVLITGETGAGKEVIAREVHDASPRASKSFGVLVCSAVPREMLDSHLFGHRRGAFTGAIDNFLGVIRANEGGTLFLDEIGEVSLDLQVKLLRFLETGEVHPLGETKPVKVDVRVIAATNQPLETLMKEGRFREDLFYRLNVVRLAIPPLRERREEILPFVERFLMRECARAGRPVPDLSDEAIEHLLLYTWPGNVRQLLNEVKRILATLPVGAEVTPAVLSSDITAERQAAIAKAVAASPNQMLLRTDQPLQAAIDEVERVLLKHALATSPDQETAAAKLDITRKGLFLKRQRLGLD